jgi:MoaA/NifB/PqqE/SkfB family radical SAM enzyme
VIDLQGNCFVCSCEAWLPVCVGNIADFNSLDDIWNSSTAQALQQDIDDGKFTHCAVDRCGIIQQDQLHRVHNISINIDQSCNLSCPSCRSSIIQHTAGSEYDKKLSMVTHLVNLLQQFELPVHIIMSGNGDPLASAIMRPLIKSFRPGPTQTIRLFTNGLLLQKQLTGTAIIDNITQYFISIDAGSAEIYEQVRRPGRWSVLQSNLDFLKTVTQRTKAHVLLKFVLQQANWTDLANFVKLCKHYGFNGVINRLEDWGTWDQFAQQDVVGNAQHPQHNEAIAELRRVYAEHNIGIQFDSGLVTLINTVTQP